MRRVRTRVLIVDDHEPFRAVARELLEHAGYVACLHDCHQNFRRSGRCLRGLARTSSDQQHQQRTEGDGALHHSLSIIIGCAVEGGCTTRFWTHQRAQEQDFLTPSGVWHLFSNSFCQDF